MSPLRVRSALPSDHALIVKLFPELGVEDAPPSAAAFEELLPVTVVAELDGVGVGFARYRASVPAGWLINVVTHPNFRRRGVARALVLEIAARLRAIGGRSWGLMVRIGNVAATRLYEQLGMHQTRRAATLRLKDPLAPSVPVPSDRSLVSRSIRAEEIPAVEQQFELPGGSLTSGTVLVLESVSIVAVARVHPDIPLARYFAVATPALTGNLLAAVRAILPQAEKPLFLIIEQPEVEQLLRNAGAELRMETMTMIGELPIAG